VLPKRLWECYDLEIDFVIVVVYSGNIGNMPNPPHTYYIIYAIIVDTVK